MLASRIIPCLDCRDGRVVKGVKFQNLRDSGDPVELSLNYQEQGADELVLLDVSATPEGRSHQLETVRAIRKELSIPLTVGGGVREEEDAEALLRAGADKVGVNTRAVTEPQFISKLSQRFGAQCTVVAIDAAKRGDSWEVVTHSGKNNTGKDAIEWTKDVRDLGAGEILLTSWDRDGTRKGYDLELIKAASAACNLPIIASGGASNPDHLLEAFQVGANAVLAASIFHEGEYSISDIKDFLKTKGIQLRQ